MAYLEKEIEEITKVIKENGTVLKVIIESGVLTNDEIIKCCDLYKHFPIDYMKTSTGYAEKELQ